MEFFKMTNTFLSTALKLSCQHALECSSKDAAVFMRHAAQHVRDAIVATKDGRGIVEIRAHLRSALICVERAGAPDHIIASIKSAILRLQEAA